MRGFEVRLSRCPVPRGRCVTVMLMQCRRPASARSFRPLHDVEEQDQLPAGEAHQNTAPQSHLPLLIFSSHERLPSALSVTLC